MASNRPPQASCSPLIEDALVSQCFAFPTCSSFYNVFHPHDPVAYRIEPLLDPALFSKGPMVVVHHHGGFRPHYMIKNIATHISDTVNIVLNPAGWFSSKVLSASSSQLNTSTTSITTTTSAVAAPQSVPSSSPSQAGLSINQRRLEECPADIPQVALNGGRRVDYMLQETGLENANEYVSSITSHTGYFDMKDVARFIVVNIW
jgi:hypothetical protein